MTATREGTTHSSGMDSSVGNPGAGKRGMNLTLRIWRQKNPSVKGKMVTYKVTDISPDMSFLEMLDVLNEQLIMQGEDPVAFDHDCREGICGMCGVMINGEALRDDENFAYVATWEWTPEGQPPVLHKEALEYEYVHLAQRSYK